MRILLSIVLNVLFFTSLSGQTDSTQKIKNLTIAPGINQVSLKDRTFSPIVFSGTIPSLRIGFGKNRNKDMWNADFAFSSGNIDYDNEYFLTIYTSAELTFNYLSKIKSSGQSAIYLGGQFSSVIDVLNYDDFDSGSWYTAQKLEPILLCTYTISEKQSIRGQFSYPIASLVARPTYAGIDEFVVSNVESLPKIVYSRSKFYSLDKLINPNLEVAYAYQFQKLAIAITGTYNYLQVNSIRKFQKHELGLYLNVNFKL